MTPDQVFENARCGKKSTGTDQLRCSTTAAIGAPNNPIMLQSRDFPSCCIHFGHIEHRDNIALAIASVSQHPSPRIDYERMSITFTAT